MATVAKVSVKKPEGSTGSEGAGALKKLGSKLRDDTSKTAEATVEELEQPTSKELGADMAAVMMKPDPDIAPYLGIQGGMSPEDLHVTVQNLGDIGKLGSPESVARKVAAVVPTEPAEVEFGGPETFEAGSNGIPVVVKVTGGRAPLDVMRQGLQGQGLPDASTFPQYEPHMTLGYAPGEAEAAGLMAEAEKKYPMKAPVPLTAVEFGWNGANKAVEPSAVAKLSMLMGAEDAVGAAGEVVDEGLTRLTHVK